MSAKIIEFSGGDGSGKTTAMTYFCDQLEAKSFRVLRTREVGNTHVPLCVKLRELILNPNQTMDGRAMELVFAAMRIENQNFYERVKDEYDFIVSDRGWLCHLAYTDHNVSPDFTQALYMDFLLHETRLPDKVYLFNVIPEISLARRTRRGEAMDAIEAKGPAFQAKVLESYLSRANEARDIDDIDVVEVDANESLEDVKRFMDEEVHELVAPRR